MKIPSKINILGCEIPIQHCSADEMIEDDKVKIGEFNFENVRIRLLDTLDDSTKSIVLMHEIIEALNWYGDLEMDHIQIGALGAMLHQVLTNNKLLKE